MSCARAGKTISLPERSSISSNLLSRSTAWPIFQPPAPSRPRPSLRVAGKRSPDPTQRPQQPPVRSATLQRNFRNGRRAPRRRSTPHAPVIERRRRIAATRPEAMTGSNRVRSGWLSTGKQAMAQALRRQKSTAVYGFQTIEITWDSLLPINDAPLAILFIPSGTVHLRCENMPVSRASVRSVRPAS